MKKSSDAVIYPIHWVLARFKSPGHRTAKIWAGFCGKTGHLFKLEAQMLPVMIIQNLYASSTECEEGTACLNKQCPLNRTTRASFQERTGIKLKGEPSWNLGEKRLEDFPHLGPFEGEHGTVSTNRKHGPLIEFSQ